MKKKLFNGRRKFLFGTTSLALGSLLFGYQALSKQAKKLSIKPKQKPNARLGINFSGIAYWGSEFPFVNLMYQSSEWVSQPVNGDWGNGPKLALDDHGWIKKLETGCKATKILTSLDNAQYPSGTYIILYDGEGEISLKLLVGKIKKTKQGRLEVDIDASKGQFQIDVVSTNPQNYLRNLRVIMPGFESSYESNAWRPDFLKRWTGVACIRLMDMMATNNSNQVNWKNRPQLNDHSYIEKGLPVELLVDLANRLNTDAWFCMPHQANDDYMQQFAAVVKHKLNSKLRVWIEYSNEVWNGSFNQFAYASKKGQAMRLGNNAWESAFHYNAYRSVAMFKIWNNVFKDEVRVVNVIASQSSNIWLGEQLLKQPEVAETADVLAIAPYVAMNIPPKENDEGLSANKIAKWNLDQVFDYMNKKSLPKAKSNIAKYRKMADKNSLILAAYEAGQHLVGIQGAENNKQLTNLLIKANSDKRMGAVYTKHLQYWQQAGGDLICLFNSTGDWSKWGSWGLLRNYKENGSDSPKFKAAMDWAQSRKQIIKY